MKTIKLKYILLVVLIGLGFGCEDFLDKKPHDAVAMDQAFTNLNDLEVGLNGVYSGMKGGSYLGLFYTNYGDISTDAVQSIIGYSNQLGELYKWNIQSGTQDIRAMWAQMYSAVIRACNVINAAETIEVDPEDQVLKDQIVGEALMARAFTFFNLVRAWAEIYDPASASTDLGIPIVLKYEYGAEPSRNTVDEVYKKIIEDVTEAKKLMKFEREEPSRYFSAAAADALLARVYLFMGDWDNAITFSSNVISNTNFHLLEGAEFEDMWLNDAGAEIIWKVAYTPTDMSGTPGYNYYNDSQGDPNPDYMPANWLLDLYDQEKDVRWDAYFKTVMTARKYELTLVHKYPTNPLFSQTGCNMIKVFRLAEQYLIRAEAHSMKDEDGLARQDLNTLRSKRINGYVADESLTGAVLKKVIWEERIKELAFEGHYLWDLKRKGLGFKRVPQDHGLPGANELEIRPDDHRWLWPIPQDERNGNDNIEQNPKY